MSNMRIGGLASGMDIDKIVGDLMKAERMPLDKMEQEKTTLTWKRDAYRDVNKQLFELENMAFDMKLESSYNSKTTTSSNPGAVTATANAESSVGNYNIEVSQIATAAINTSREEISGASKIDPSGKLVDQDFKNGLSDADGAADSESFTIRTYNKDGSENKQTFDFNPQEDSLNYVLKQINDSDLGVRAFYDKASDKVVMERTETGNFNQSGDYKGAEIAFDSNNAKFLTQTLGVWNGKEDADGNWVKAEEGGTNAKFTYNNALDIETTENNYTLNGVTYNFNDTTNGQNASINVNNNVDASVEKVTKFIEKYNEVIDNLNTHVSERKNREYQPLTEKQKESMEEKQIEMWEEQAKKGLLQGDSVIRGALSEMRNEWYESVETSSGSFSHLSEIGIETSSNFRDGGKLIIDEDKLRQKLNEDPSSVAKLFVGEGETEGIADKLKTTLNETVSSVERKAGKATSVPSSYTLGKDIKEVNTEMDEFQERLNQIEDRYWSQFTQMEKAIQKMNSQSQQLMQQMG